MPQFPSAEWMDEFCERLAAQPDSDDVAVALEGVYRFVIEPAGPVARTHTYDIAIRPDGDAARASRLDDLAPEPRLVLTATYDRWKQLVMGRLDIGMAVMLRRLKVSGDLGRLMRDVGTTQPLLRALGEVESVWPDE
jgi:hypothetical protein